MTRPVGRSAFIPFACVGGLLCAAPSFSQGATLPGEQVAELISGSWECDPVETPEANRGDHTCDKQPEVIRIDETGDGLVFGAIS